MRKALVWVGLIVSLTIVSSAASLAAGGSAMPSRLARHPCASLMKPWNRWTIALIDAGRREAKRFLPRDVWHALEEDRYYVCFVGYETGGEMDATSYKLPIPALGQRMWYRDMWELDSPPEARAAAAEARADPVKFLSEDSSEPRPRQRLEGIRVLGRFLVMTLSDRRDV